MPTRYSDGSYEEHRRAAELHDAPAHTHRVAERQRGMQDHLTGAGHSPLEFDRLEEEHLHAKGASVGHGIAAFGHEDIAALAYELWESRGRPEGSPDEDWFNAVKELRYRAIGG